MDDQELKYLSVVGGSQTKKYQLPEIVLLGIVAVLMDISAVLADLLSGTVIGLVASIPMYIFNYAAILLIYLYFFLKGSYGTASIAALITGFGIANAMLPVNLITVLLVTFIENKPKLAAIANVVGGVVSGEAAAGEVKVAETAEKAGQGIKAVEEGAEAAGSIGVGGMEAETAAKDVEEARAAGQETEAGTKKENITKPEEEKEGARPEETEESAAEEGDKKIEENEEEPEENSGNNYQPPTLNEEGEDEDEGDEAYREAA